MKKADRWMVITMDTYDYYNREFDNYSDAFEHYVKMVNASKDSAELNRLRDFDYPETKVIMSKIHHEYNPYEVIE